MFRTATGVGAVVLAFLVGSGPAVGQPPAYFDQIGYTALQSRLGTATPTGAGIRVSQIEASEVLNGNAYLPNSATFPGKTITDKTGGGAVSSHATIVGQHFYGDQSIAP